MNHKNLIAQADSENRLIGIDNQRREESNHLKIVVEWDILIHCMYTRSDIFLVVVPEYMACKVPIVFGIRVPSRHPRTHDNVVVSSDTPMRVICSLDSPTQEFPWLTCFTRCRSPGSGVDFTGECDRKLNVSLRVSRRMER